MTDPIRRVVVAQTDSSGTSSVLHDGPAPAVMSLPAAPGTALVDIWRSEALPVPRPTNEDPTTAEFELMPAGSLFRIIDLAPTGDAEPMWHQTGSVDFIYVASGTATFLHDGGSVWLGPGDTIVVGGVRHAWVNGGTEVCRLVDVSLAVASTSAP